MIFYAYFFCCLSQNNYLCALIFSHLLNMQSHPTWVRGLKHNVTTSFERRITSHPTWVRGLKHVKTKVKSMFCVAPYVGAWIETSEKVQKAVLGLSHPTWVRGLKHVKTKVKTALCKVAPYVGAWIETQVNSFKFFDDESHPTWVRGLKLQGV